MNIKEIQTKVQEIFKKNANPKNVILLLSALTLVSFLAFIAIKQSTTEDYAVLYTHLSPDDAGSILSVLQEEHIPYKVEGNGSIILVPKEKVYDIRLKLAAKGLPHGKVVGFELFDEPKLGITQFQENVEFLRALEGEIERTIKRINAIQDVKVNIALPKDSIFVRESEEPKASILVNLWPGRELTKEQVKAIVFLVSHAVPGLKPENVTVIDNRGRVLTDLLSGNEDETGSSKELEVKRKLEKEIERKIQSMLSQVLGSGKVVVRASVEIETGRLEKKEELYDPDMTAVVSERKIQEKETGIKPKEQGVPGTTTNVPPVLNLNQGNEILKKEKKDVTTNYDVSKTIQKTITPIFKIKRISVGVLVDGKYQKEKDKAGNEIIKFVPRSQEEIKTYEEIVKSAIGYDPKRGDTVTVASVPFEAKQFVQKEKSQKKFPWIYIAAGGGLLTLILVGIIALKLLKSKKTEPQQPEIPETLMAEMKARAEHKEELEELHIESDPLYIKIVEIAKEHPELVANVISKWIREEGISK